MKYTSLFQLTVKCADLFQYLHILDHVNRQSLIIRTETNPDTYEIIYTAVFNRSLAEQEDYLKQHYPTVTIVEKAYKDNHA